MIIYKNHATFISSDQIKHRIRKPQKVLSTRSTFSSNVKAQNCKGPYINVVINLHKVNEFSICYLNCSAHSKHWYTNMYKCLNRMHKDHQFYLLFKFQLPGMDVNDGTSVELKFKNVDILFGQS